MTETKTNTKTNTKTEANIKNSTDVDLLAKVNERGKNTLAESLGIEFIEVSDELLRAKMPVDHRTKQPMGLLHGGASLALAETLGSVGSSLILAKTSPNSMPVGLEINGNHLKSARSGFVIGTAKALKIGQSIHVWAIEIHDELGELVCTSRLTVMVRSRK